MAATDDEEVARGMRMLQELSIDSSYAARDTDSEEGGSSDEVLSIHQSRNPSLGQRRPSASNRDLIVDTSYSTLNQNANTPSALTPASLVSPAASLFSNATALAATPRETTPRQSVLGHAAHSPTASPRTKALPGNAFAAPHPTATVESSPLASTTSAFQTTGPAGESTLSRRASDSGSSSSGSSSSGSSQSDEEEDPDNHPLYKLLSTSARPTLRSAWDATSLVIVPPRKSMPDISSLQGVAIDTNEGSPGKGFQFIRGGKGATGEIAGRDEEAREQQLESFVKLHVFEPTRDPLIWHSVGQVGNAYLEVRLEPARGLVHVALVATPSTGQRARSASVASTLPTLSETRPSSGYESSESGILQTPPSLLLPAIDAGKPLDLTLLGESALQTGSSTSSAVQLAPDPARSTSVQIVTEAIIYRKVKTAPLSVSGSTVAQPAKSKGGFRTPKWLRRGSFSSSSKVKLPAPEPAPLLERVRIIAVDGTVLPPSVESTAALHTKRLRSKSKLSLTHQMSSLSLRRTRSDKSARTRPSLEDYSELSLATLDCYRNLARDVAFLVEPPEALSSLRLAFQDTYITLRRLTREFARNFAYISGLDKYIIQRIRKGIWTKCFYSLAQHVAALGEPGIAFLHEHEQHLKRLLENIILGFLYPKLFVSAVLPANVEEDEAVEHILNDYRQRSASLNDFGVTIAGLEDVQSRFDSSIAALNQMHAPSRDGVTALTEKIVTELQADELPSLSTIYSLRTVATPLGIVSCARQAIEEAVSAIEKSRPGTRVAPDDLIPLLAYLIVRSKLVNLASLLSHVRTFRLSSMLSPEDDWSFVTLQAAVAFLLGDPLRTASTEDACSPQTSPNVVRHRPDVSSRRRPPYRVPSRSVSPASASSPRSARVIGGSASHKASAMHASRARTSQYVKASAMTAERERRLSWQQSRLSASSSKRPSLEDDRERGSSRGRSSQESDRGYQAARQSLGFLPLASQSSTNVSEVAASSTSVRSRRQSLPALQTAYDSHVRPRLVIATASSAASLDKSPTHPLMRSQSTESRQPEQLAASQDMQRSRSDTTNSPNPGSNSASPIPRSHSEIWRLWGIFDSGERTSSPAPSAATRTSEEFVGSTSDDHSSYFWDWTRGSRSSGTTSPPTSTGHHSFQPSFSTSGPSSPPLAPIPQRRERRHSVSAAEALTSAGRTADLSASTSAAYSSARLAAMLNARPTAHSQRAARPKSIMSISSVSSLDTDGGGVFASQLATSGHSDLSASQTISPTRPSTLAPSRRSTMSLMHSDVNGPHIVPPRTPVAPRVDHAVVTLFSRSMTDDGSQVGAEPVDARRSFDDNDGPERRPRFSTATIRKMPSVPSVRRIGSDFSMRKGILRTSTDVSV